MHRPGTSASPATLSLLLLCASCGPDLSSVPRITPADLRAALAQGTAVAVDVRLASDYSRRHIKGALSMPLSQVEARAKELPTGKKIVTYCA